LEILLTSKGQLLSCGNLEFSWEEKRTEKSINDFLKKYFKLRRQCIYLSFAISPF
jgi:hypothetical protein